MQHDSWGATFVVARSSVRNYVLTLSWGALHLSIELCTKLPHVRTFVVMVSMLIQRRYSVVSCSAEKNICCYSFCIHLSHGDCGGQLCSNVLLTVDRPANLDRLLWCRQAGLFMPRIII